MSDVDVHTDVGLRGALQHFSRVSCRIQDPADDLIIPPDLKDAWESLFRTYLDRHILPQREQAQSVAGAGEGTPSVHLSALAASPLFPAWSRVAFASWLLHLKPGESTQEPEELEEEDENHRAFTESVELTCQALYAGEYSQVIAAANADTARRLAHLARDWGTTVYVLTFMLCRHGVLGSRDLLLSLGRLQKDGLTLAKFAAAIADEHALTFCEGKTLEPKTICARAVRALGGSSTRKRLVVSKKKGPQLPQQSVQQPASPGPGPIAKLSSPVQPRLRDRSEPGRNDGFDNGRVPLQDQWSDDDNGYFGGEDDLDGVSVDQEKDREPDSSGSAVIPTKNNKTIDHGSAPAECDYNKTKAANTASQGGLDRAASNPFCFEEQEEEAAAAAAGQARDTGSDAAAHVDKTNHGQDQSFAFAYSGPNKFNDRHSTASPTPPETGRRHEPENNEALALDVANYTICGDEERHVSRPVTPSSPSLLSLPSRQHRISTPSFDFEFGRPSPLPVGSFDIHDTAAAAAPHGLISSNEQGQSPSHGLMRDGFNNVTIREQDKKRQRSGSELLSPPRPSRKQLKKTFDLPESMARQPAFYPREQDQQQRTGMTQQEQPILRPDPDPDPQSSLDNLNAPGTLRSKGPSLQDVYSSVGELDAGQLVSDHIINASIRHLRTNASPLSESIAIVDSLTPDAFSRTAQTRRATLALFPRRYESIIIPVNDRAGYHWFLCHFCFVEERSGADARPHLLPTLKVLDPLAGPGLHSSSTRLSAEHIRDWLVWLLSDDPRLQQGGTHGAIAIEPYPCPKQPNSFDCGPYTIMFASCILEGLSLPQELPDSATMRAVLRQSLFTAQQTLMTRIAATEAAGMHESLCRISRRPGLAWPELCNFARRHAAWDVLDSLGGGGSAARSHTRVEPTRRIRELEAAEACVFMAALAAERAEVRHRAAIGRALAISQSATQLADLRSREMEALQTFLNAESERKVRENVILGELDGLIDVGSGGQDEGVAEALMHGMMHNARALRLLKQSGGKRRQVTCTISRAAKEAWGICVAWCIIRRKAAEREEALYERLAKSEDIVGVSGG